MVAEVLSNVPTLLSVSPAVRGMSSNETTPPPPATDPPAVDSTATDPPATDSLSTDPPAPVNETLYDPFEDPVTNETSVAPPVADPSVALNEAPDNQLQDPVYNTIMSQQNYTVPHKCYVAITSNPTGATKKHFPVVWCDFRTLFGLNVTAEIKDGSCGEFEEQSSGDVFTRGVASTIFFPEITEEEKLDGTIEHEYCARLDYLYDAGGTGDHARSVLDKRFPMVVTYLYKEDIDQETEQIVEDLIDVKLTDENTTEDERDLDLILGLSFLAGSLFMVALIAIIVGGSRKRKKEKQRLQQMMEEGGVDVEITPITAPIKEENEII